MIRSQMNQPPHVARAHALFKLQTRTLMYSHRYTIFSANFDPINIENFCVRDGICWCSHDPVLASNYFVTSSKNFNNSCSENFMPTSPQLDPDVAAIL